MYRGSEYSVTFLRKVRVEIEEEGEDEDNNTSEP
jgi:hypothetical protein